VVLDISSLEVALKQLEQVLERTEDPTFFPAQDDITRNVIRAGVIQHFEIVYELCWKFMQRWLRDNLNPEEADYPRTRKELFRMAARTGLLEDPLPWFGYGEARNLTAHTYNEKEAAIVYAQCGLFAKDARVFFERLKERND
jgi:nucleotidyltransferase substrate binding protein (TIGR01987 family)